MSTTKQKTRETILQTIIPIRIQTWIHTHTQSAITFVKVYGIGFFVYALFMNALDEILIPGILALSGHPIAGGLFILGDLDWFTYPLYFVITRIFTK